ncbi:MAG: hypothetical protein RMM53_11040 [Bacteroidia bacterium]|nr:hypothetical protein [Bacteroidia bacterium]
MRLKAAAHSTIDNHLAIKIFGVANGRERRLETQAYTFEAEAFWLDASHEIFCKFVYPTNIQTHERI